MITKITGEQPFQVLTSNFSISPSSEGYTLQISADGTNFSNLFTVGAGVTRLVTGVAANSYYRLSGNQSKVSINWMKTCVTEGGAAGNELTPVTEFPLNADPGTVVALASGDTYGIYQYDGTNWNEAGADVDLSAYWTSGETQSAITVVEDHLFDFEEVTSSALTELHEGLLEVSGRTVDMSDYWTSAQTEDAISAATSGKADAANIAANTGNYIFPKWNSQGIISGVSQQVFKSYLLVNDEGTGAYFFMNSSKYETQNKALKLYTPLSAGTAGDILVSTGNGAPVWSAMTFPTPDVDKTYVDSAITGVQDQIDVMDEVVATSLVDLNTRKVESTSVHTIWKGTQAEYDAIATKDPATLYIIL